MPLFPSHMCLCFMIYITKVFPCVNTHKPRRIIPRYYTTPTLCHNVILQHITFSEAKAMKFAKERIKKSEQSFTCVYMDFIHQVMYIPNTLTLCLLSDFVCVQTINYRNYASPFWTQMSHWGLPNPMVHFLSFFQCNSDVWNLSLPAMWLIYRLEWHQITPIV